MCPVRRHQNTQNWWEEGGRNYSSHKHELPEVDDAAAHPACSRDGFHDDLHHQVVQKGVTGLWAVAAGAKAVTGLRLIDTLPKRNTGLQGAILQAFSHVIRKSTMI